MVAVLVVVEAVVDDAVVEVSVCVVDVYVCVWSEIQSTSKPW